MARDRDLRLILEERGLLEEFEARKFACEHCGTTMTWNNLGVVVVRKGELRFYCELPDCIEQASET